MLPYLLALVMATAGLAVYATAFFFPKLYRKNDLIWSGVALFYALVLWFCARRLTGAVLLGQAASMALIGWLGYQVVQFRWSQLPGEERSQIADGSSLKEGLNRLKATDWKGLAQSTSETVKNASSAVFSSAAGADAASSKADSAQETSSTPIAAVTDAIAKAKGFVQGRKTHGKKYVRPEATDAPATASTPSPAKTAAPEPEASADEWGDEEEEWAEEPVNAEPEEAEPAEAEPAEAEPVEAEPTEAEPVKAEPAEVESSDEAELPEAEVDEDEAEELEEEAETSVSTESVSTESVSAEEKPSVEETPDEPETSEKSSSETLSDEDYSQEVPEEDYSQEAPEEDYSQEPVVDGEAEESDEADEKA